MNKSERREKKNTYNAIERERERERETELH